MALTDNLVSYYKLDESSGNASDSVGSNTLGNNNSVTYGAALINNGATVSAASSQSLSIANASQSGLDFGAGDFSISFWFKPGTTGSLQGLIGKRQSSGNAQGYVIYIGDVGAKRIELYLYDSGGGSYERNANTDLTTGVFNHVVVVRGHSGGNEAVSIYLNGTDVTASGGSSSLRNTSNSGSFSIGGDSSTAFSNGTFDEVGVWSRALSSTEVTALYNGGSGLSYPFSAGGSAAKSLALLGVG